MKVLPLSGIENLHFGMSMQEVRHAWGQPSDIYYFHPLSDDLEYRDVIWEYDNGVELSFSSDDGFMLGTMTVSAESAELDGKNIIGKSIKEARLMFPSLQPDDDFDEQGKDYFLSDREISVWVVNNKVDSMSVYPDYDDTGTMKVAKHIVSSR